MSDVKAVILELCVVAITVSIYKILLPNGNVRKIGEIIFAILILSTALKPISSTIHFEQFSIDSIENNTEVQSQNEAYKKAVESVFIKALEKSKIQCNGVTADVNCENAQTIIIQQVVVNIETKLSDEEVKSLLQSQTQVPSEVIVIQRGNYEES